MRSPFPGMDPYLEHPSVCPDVHNSLITAIRDFLAPRLRPEYYVAIEERSYLLKHDELVFVGVPDVAVIERRSREAVVESPETASLLGVLDVEVPVRDEIRETFLEVREVAGGDVVTVLEILSPANKLHARGREDYEAKREDIFGTRTSFVEIDLLRAGEPMPLVSDSPPPSDYRILVSRGWRRPRAALYPFGVRQPIPSFPLPLRRDDRESEVDLQAILGDLYERASFDLRVDYARPPSPPLEGEDARWAAEVAASSEDDEAK